MFECLHEISCELTVSASHVDRNTSLTPGAKGFSNFPRQFAVVFWIKAVTIGAVEIVGATECLLKTGMLESGGHDWILQHVDMNPFLFDGWSF